MLDDGPAPPVVVVPPAPPRLQTAAHVTGGWGLVYSHLMYPVTGPTVLPDALPLTGDVTVGFWLTNSASTQMMYGVIFTLFGAQQFGLPDDASDNFVLLRHNGRAYYLHNQSGDGLEWTRPDSNEALFVVEVVTTSTSISGATTGKVRVWVEDMITPLIDVDGVPQRHNGDLGLFKLDGYGSSTYSGMNYTPWGSAIYARDIVVYNRSLTEVERTTMKSHPPSDPGDAGASNM